MQIVSKQQEEEKKTEAEEVVQEQKVKEISINNVNPVSESINVEKEGEPIEQEIPEPQISSRILTDESTRTDRISSALE